MRDSQHGGQGDRSGEDLSALARSVIVRLAVRDGLGQRPVDRTVVAALAKAMADADPSHFAALKPELRRARISETDLVDTYFPEAARLLGCAWAEDRAAFTEVTLGVSRMQSIVRQIGRDWASNSNARPDSATVLLVLPPGEQHSFGLIVLAGQLRRKGISVQLQLGTGPAELAALVQQKRFDCAMISVACEERLELCARVVKALRQGSGGQLRVAVGGAVLERMIDVKAMTGADVVTNDPMQALEEARRWQVLPVSEVG
jgi:methylmalonyl-CoA mutase cobalamin-binding subunit